MIPADHISFNDDGTAWLVVDSAPAAWEQDDKPCDTCEGFGYELMWEDDNTPTCSHCNGTGRHTFDIEVDRICPGGGDLCGGDEPHQITSLTYRVSIVPGMVLPITSDGRVTLPPSALWWDTEPTEVDARLIGISGGPLPPAAKPGMWAVKLKVAD